jgi:hypothetical protein
MPVLYSSLKNRATLPSRNDEPTGMSLKFCKSRVLKFAHARPRVVRTENSNISPEKILEYEKFWIVVNFELRRPQLSQLNRWPNQDDALEEAMKLARQSPQDTYTVLEAITTVFSQSPPLEVVTLRENTSGKTVKPPIDDEDDDEEIAHLAPAATRRSSSQTP